MLRQRPTPPCAGRGGALLGAILLPAAALHTQRRCGPRGTQPINGLGDCSPGTLDEIVAIEDDGDGDALSGREHAEARRVGEEHAHFLEDLPCGGVELAHDRSSAWTRSSGLA